MKIKSLIAFALTAVMAFTPLTLFANTNTQFNDVPATHPAAEAIAWVSNPANGVFMVGDLNNNFNPSRVVTSFEGVQIFAAAAGFRHVTAALPQAEREMFARSFDTWRNTLDGFANQHNSWNRTLDREIAYLLYVGIITIADVSAFITGSGQNETITPLSRERALTWLVRLLDHPEAVGAIPLPNPNPFGDDANITPALRRYMYFARQNNIFSPINNMALPTQSITRADLATFFFNALSENGGSQSGSSSPGTISGTIESVLGGSISIRTGFGAETLQFATNAVIMVDGVQRTVAFLEGGMGVTVLINNQRQVMSLVARTDVAHGTGSSLPTDLLLYSDEGFVVGTAGQSITIRTQRVRISGEIVDEERTFTVAANANVIRGGLRTNLNNVQAGDMAFFRFSGSVIHEITLIERNRTLNGVLLSSQPADSFSGMPTLTIELDDGRLYSLRVTPATVFVRNGVQNLNWTDIRIGDNIVVNTEYDRILSVHALGLRTTVNGRLVELMISERNSQITLALLNGEIASYFVVPGVFDIYALRIGQNLNVTLDSREVVDITLQGTNIAQATSIVGYIQALHPDGSITIAEGTGASRRTVRVNVNNTTSITRSGVTVNRDALRVNMNVHVTLTAPQSNIAQSITILP